jgi:hypothetical protein
MRERTSFGTVGVKVGGKNLASPPRENASAVEVSLFEVPLVNVALELPPPLAVELGLSVSTQ